MDFRSLTYKLRQRRQKLGRTQLQVATQIGVDRTVLCRWETSDRHPQMIQFMVWAQALGLEVELQDHVGETR